MFKFIYKLLKTIAIIIIIAIGYNYLSTDKDFTDSVKSKLCGVGVDDVKKLEALNSFLEFYDKFQKERE
jgi:hypothetical protein